MGQDSRIGWTHHTFAALRGCVRVAGSPACQAADGGVACYAEAMARRNPKVLGTWGPEGSRVFGVDAYWQQPVKWNAAAEKAGVPALVFTTSMGDWFEGVSERCRRCMGVDDIPFCLSCGGRGWIERRDGVRADFLPHLARLWTLIKATPWLRWQVLTKRPWNMARYAKEHGWPANAWAGSTAETQALYNERTYWLRRVPAPVRFVSIEPMVEAINVDPTTCPDCESTEHVRWPGDKGMPAEGNPWCIECDTEAGGGLHLDACASPTQAGINWVIVGCESSGPREGKRKMDLEWVRAIRDQCVRAGVPLFFKQAAVDGKIVHGPELDGKTWLQFPEAA